MTADTDGGGLCWVPSETWNKLENAADSDGEVAVALMGMPTEPVGRLRLTRREPDVARATRLVETVYDRLGWGEIVDITEGIVFGTVGYLSLSVIGEISASWDPTDTDGGCYIGEWPLREDDEVIIQFLVEELRDAALRRRLRDEGDHVATAVLEGAVAVPVGTDSDGRPMVLLAGTVIDQDPDRGITRVRLGNGDEIDLPGDTEVSTGGAG